MLFSISTIFTESITAKKYEAYHQYKKQASAIIFKFSAVDTQKRFC
jgi:hypothetical protein